MNSYELSRYWFNWCFENPEKINPNHTALYFFCIEHCNRLGWKEKYGLPTTMAKEAIGIRSYNTYIKTLNDLVDFGFIKIIEKSKNQYSSNIIALSKFTKALDKALDKAFIKHLIKQDESTRQSNDSIDKQQTINNITTNNKQEDDVENKEIIKKPNQINQYFLDLENCSELETISMNAKVSMDYIRQKIISFRPKAELEYPNWKEFIKHFKNYVNKELETEKNGTRTNKSASYNSNKARINELSNAARTILSDTSNFQLKGGDTE